MNPAAVRSTLAVAALLWGLAAAQGSPPWGAVPYVAEVAQFVDDEPIETISIEAAPAGLRYSVRSQEDGLLLDVLLTWDGADWAAYIVDASDGTFGPAFPGFGEAVLQSVVDPRTPEVGACAQEGTTCVEEGEEAYGDRRALRMSLAIEGLGTSVVWVDLATGLTVGSEGASSDLAVRSELVRLEERAPDPARLRP